MKITVVGTGYVGLVTGVCLAAIGHDVTCIERLSERVAAVNAGLTPIHEPGLPELLGRVLATDHFRATTSWEVAMADSTVSIIAVGTPTTRGRIDLTALENAARQVGQALATRTQYHVVVVKSTVVPGTTAGLVRQTLESASGRPLTPDTWGLAMNPEFLREGCAVEDFMQPDRLVWGESDSRAGDILAQLYAPFSCPLIRTTLQNAEMTKYASNALLATLVSFGNELAGICERQPGADMDTVLDAMCLDRRISPLIEGTRVTPSLVSYLRPGIGFGGSCLPKDVAALRAHGDELGTDTPLLDAVSQVNACRPDMVLSLLGDADAWSGKTVVVLGLAFKPGTDDMRDSPALALIERLLARGAQVRGYDPLVGAAVNGLLSCAITLAETSEAALLGADVAIIATAWPEFQGWDWPSLLETMKTPIVLDGRNALDPAKLGPLAQWVPMGRAPS